MAKEIAYEKYGAKRHTMLPATKRKQAKAKKAEAKGPKAKKADKPKQQETRVSSKTRATRGSSGDSQSRYSDALEQQGLDLYISPEQEAKAAEDRTARDAKRGSKLYSGQEDKLPSTVTAEAGSLDRLKAAEDYSLDTIAEDAPAPDAPAPGDSQVLTDPNDGRYQYQILANGSIKIVAAPEDTDFKGMILDDPTSKAHKAIMGVFKSGESPSAGTGGADPTDRVDSSGSGPGTSEPADDLSFSSRDVADRTWDQYYGAPLETTPPDGPYQDWSHLDPKGQVEMEPLTTTSDPTEGGAGEGEEPPPQSDPEPQYLTGDEGAAAHKKWAESHPSSEQVVPEDQPVAAPESAPDVVSSDTSALDGLADIRPEGLGSRALDDEAMLASATDAARMAQARETHVPMNPEDKPKYAGTTSDQEDNLRRLREMYKTEGVETAPNLGESPPEDFDVGQYEHNLPPQSAAGAAGQPKYAGTTSDQEDNLRRLREMYKTEGVETAPNLGESPPAVDDVVGQYEHNLPPQSEQPDFMGRNRAVDLAWEKDELSRLVRGKSEEQRAMVSGILKGKHGAELAAAIKRIRSIISRGES